MKSAAGIGRECSSRSKLFLLIPGSRPFNLNSSSLQQLPSSSREPDVAFLARCPQCNHFQVCIFDVDSKLNLKCGECGTVFPSIARAAAVRDGLGAGDHIARIRIRAIAAGNRRYGYCPGSAVGVPKAPPVTKIAAGRAVAKAPDQSPDFWPIQPRNWQKIRLRRARTPRVWSPGDCHDSRLANGGICFVNHYLA